MPMNILFFLTIPDVRYPKCGKLYPVSFVMCMAWIGLISYVVTWSKCYKKFYGLNLRMFVIS